MCKFEHYLIPLTDGVCLLIGNILSVDDVSISSREYLSKSVVEFRPTPRHSPVSIPVQTLTQQSQHFLQRYVMFGHVMKTEHWQLMYIALDAGT